MQSNTVVAAFIVMLILIGALPLSAQVHKDRKLIQIDIYSLSYIGVHTFVDWTPDVLVRLYPNRTRMVTITEPLLLRQCAALVEGIEKHPPGWYQGIDSRLVCLLRYSDQTTDTVAFG